MSNLPIKHFQISLTLSKYLLLQIISFHLVFSLINSSNTNPSCQTYECRFSDYLRQHDITFLSPLEKTYRFRIFKKNLREIATFNESHPEIHLDLNNFGLLTRKEFKKTMTNPDFLFVDGQGEKHHVNVNDPRNEEVIDKEIYEGNEETLDAIKKEIEQSTNANPLVMLEWDIEDAQKAVDKELGQLHSFLKEHESRIEDDTELLDADGCKVSFNVFL